MDDWTHEQLAAAVEAYRWMQVRTAEGLKLNKTQLDRYLALKYGRTPKAWEYRMKGQSLRINRRATKDADLPRCFRQTSPLVLRARRFGGVAPQAGHGKPPMPQQRTPQENDL